MILEPDLYNFALVCNGHYSYDHGDQRYQVVWSWSLQWFVPYLAYDASILDDVTILTFYLNKQ
jgi:hypothetical protein